MCKLIELNKDLFTINDGLEPSEQYVLAHCISADFALGAGIAKEFDRRFNVKQKLCRDYAPYGATYWINQFYYDRGYVLQTDNIYNLVTKCYYHNKPTLAALQTAVKKLREALQFQGVKRVAMPRIGCGLDRLYWPTVKSIISLEFSNTDIEVVICSLEEE